MRRQGDGVPRVRRARRGSRRFSSGWKRTKPRGSRRSRQGVVAPRSARARRLVRGNRAAVAVRESRRRVVTQDGGEADVLPGRVEEERRPRRGARRLHIGAAEIRRRERSGPPILRADLAKLPVRARARSMFWCLTGVGSARRLAHSHARIRSRAGSDSCRRNRCPLDPSGHANRRGRSLRPAGDARPTSSRRRSWSV